MNSNIAELLQRNAITYQSKPALIQGDDTVTYAELAAQVQQRATSLQSRGITRGDSVLVFIPMSIALYRDLIALCHIGAVAVFIDAWAGRDRIENACRLVNPRAFIGIPRAHLLRLMSSAIRRIPLKLIPGTGNSHNKESISVAVVDGDHPALVTFTTGSTGTPRAAVRTHGFLLAQHQVLVDSFGVEEDGVDMPLLPIFTLSNLASGVTSLLPSVNHRKVSSFDVTKVVGEITRYGVTTTTGSPAFYNRLAQYCVEKGIRLSGLHHIITGGAPVFPEHAELLIKAFPDTRITIAYGSTEAEPISLIDAPDLLETASHSDVAGLPAGHPISDIELRILSVRNRNGDTDGVEYEEQNASAPYDVGEIVVFGNHVLQTYLGTEESWSASKIMIDGKRWHRTGDAGYLDDRGNLFLMGRVRQSFWHEGKLVMVFPVERQLAAIEGVVSGTILKIDSGRIIAVELDRDMTDIDRMRQDIRKIGIGFDDVIVVRHIPRDPRHHSKIDYDRLQREIMRHTREHR